MAVRCYNVITLTGTRMSHCRNIQGKRLLSYNPFHIRQVFLLNLGASALLGYEAVNNGNRLLDDGASLRKYESFIYGGAVTPTEAGAVAGAYALIVSVLVYRMLNWESLKKILAGNSEDCRHGFHNRGAVRP